MTLHRWQRDPKLRFPQPSIIMGKPLTNIADVDEWLRARVRVLA